MRHPSISSLDPSWARVAREIAGRLAREGARAWIVGGAVRDLALEREAVDVDMASRATPDQVRALFEHTVDVGVAFGTVLVRARGREVQVTTFRSESGYRDARHPDVVKWGEQPEEDARRRDFTCNALYLDPLDDTLLDPVGGMADLAARRLRCVGDPHERFREDGLRLVRLARFAAALDFEPDGETRKAARAEGDSLGGVSGERLRGELRRIFEGPRPRVAVALLIELQLLQRLLPAVRADVEARLPALEQVEGLADGLALLLEPGGEALKSLRPSRELRREVLGLWSLTEEAAALLAGGVQPRSLRVRLVRDPLWPRAARLLRATLADGAALDELESFAAGLTEAERRPPPLIVPRDLEATGLARGPAWGRILREAEDLQLDGELRTAEDAAAWLAERAAQEGGNARRREKDSG